jgi:hypothetical protein
MDNREHLWERLAEKLDEPTNWLAVAYNVAFWASLLAVIFFGLWIATGMEVTP